MNFSDNFAFIGQEIMSSGSADIVSSGQYSRKASIRTGLSLRQANIERKQRRSWEN